VKDARNGCNCRGTCTRKTKKKIRELQLRRMSLMLSVVAMTFLLLSQYCRFPAKIVSHTREFVNFMEKHQYELGIRTTGGPDFKLQSDSDEEPFDPHLDCDKVLSSNLSHSFKMFDRLLLSTRLQWFDASCRRVLVRHVHYTSFPINQSAAAIVHLSPP
jgi:hypothetical protein